MNMDRQRILGFVVVLSTCVVIADAKGYPDDSVYIGHILEMVQMMSRNNTWKAAWQENAKYSNMEDQDLGLHYSCRLSPSTSTPTSVHGLRPGDIKFIAALGGSVTSGLGLGATEAFYLLYENRGKAWSGGGDGQLSALYRQYTETGTVTLPNILRQFNPGLLGYSTQSGEISYPNSRLNRAWSGAGAKDLESQVDDLYREMKDTEGMNLGFNWKLLTIFIGLHDICHACNDPDTYSVKQFMGYMERSLDKLKANIPRLLVSLVPVYNTAGLGLLTDNIVCEKSIRFLCPCALNKVNQEYGRTMQMQYYQAMKSLVDSGKYDQSHVFTVVLQPHLLNLGFPVEASDSTQPIDKALMAPDCFHPNHRGHRMMAYMLWNTMLTPVGHKSTRYPREEYLKLYCPTRSHPLIFTNNNSVGVAWVSGGFLEEEKPDDIMDIITISSVTAIAGVMILTLIIGFFVTCCCKKSKDSKEEQKYQKVDALDFPMTCVTHDDIKDSRSGPDGHSRRSSHDSNPSSCPSVSSSRRPSTDVFLNTSPGKRRSSLEPSAALNGPPHSRLYARRASEDLRRDVLNPKLQNKRTVSDGFVHSAGRKDNGKIPPRPQLEPSPQRHGTSTTADELSPKSHAKCEGRQNRDHQTGINSDTCTQIPIVSLKTSPRRPRRRTSMEMLHGME